MPNYGSGPPEVIHGWQRAANGSLAPLPGSPFPGGPAGPTPVVAGLFAFAFAPEGGRAVSSFLFTGGVQGLAVAADGSIAFAGAPVSSPSVTGLAVSPDGRFAYAPTRDFMGSLAVGITGYSIGASGALTALPTSPYSSGEIGDVAITPNGRFLYASTGAAIKRFSVGSSGALTELAPAAIAGVRTLAMAPDGRSLFTGFDGMTDGVGSYSIGVDGSLTENGLPVSAGGASMDYFTVSPSGRNVYMPESNADAIVTAAVAPDGKLTVVDSDPVADADSAAATPDGRFLYFWGGDGDDHIGVASLDAVGKPTILPFQVPAASGEPQRLLFQPQPAPVAAVKAMPGFPGADSSFDARGSARAFRYDWDFGDGTTLANGGPQPKRRYANAGIYTVRLSVTDEQGCAARQVYTGQSTTCPGGAVTTTTARLDTLPLLGRLTLKNRKFAVPPVKRKGVKRGTRLRYTLSEAARVRFTIERRLIGRRVDGKCRATTRRNRKRKACVRFKPVGGFTAAGKAGRNATKFSGKLGKRKLVPGRYRVTALATDPAGGKSGTRSASFKVVMGKKAATKPKNRD